MGFLRYFLALVVVSSHIPVVFLKPLDGHGGLAVQAFFVISGFYMSLIMEKYQLSSLRFAQLKNFYLSRLLRIFPIYYICLMITLILFAWHVVPPPPFHFPHEALRSLHSLADKAMYIFENIFIFGQSAMRFFMYDASTRSFVFAPLFVASMPGQEGAGFAVLGQAWTLSLELSFYILVPLLLIRTKKTIVMLCVLSFLLRISLSYFGYNNYNMQHAFFPSALGVFLLGALSHSLIYSWIQNKMNHYLFKIAAIGMITFLVFYTVILYHFLNNMTYKYWLFIALVTLALPFLFWVSKSSKVDRWVGELSYPIYMTHFFCIALVLKYVGLAHIGYSVFLLTNGVSILLVFLVVKPLDHFRHKRLLNLSSENEMIKLKQKEYSLSRA